MASSTSFDGDLDCSTSSLLSIPPSSTRTVRDRPVNRSRHYHHHYHRNKSNNGNNSSNTSMPSLVVTTAERTSSSTMNVSAVAIPIGPNSFESAEQLQHRNNNQNSYRINSSNSSTSSNVKNIRHKRHLREKRRPTGVVHDLSTELDRLRRIWKQSAGGSGTSSGTEEDQLSLDDDLNVKKNTRYNEMIFLSNSTTNVEPSVEEPKRKDGGDLNFEESKLRLENRRLQDELDLKDRYIQELEEKIRRITMSYPLVPLSSSPVVNEIDL